MSVFLRAGEQRLVVGIPWVPEESLSPNSRRSRDKKAIREARAAAKLETREVVLRDGPPLLPEGEIGLRWTVWWPAGRGRHDDDSVAAMLKSTRDGLAEALGVNDRRFRTLGVEQLRAEKDDRRGRTEARLVAMPEGRR